MHKIKLTILLLISAISLKPSETDPLLQPGIPKVNSSGSLNNLYGTSSENQNPSPVSQNSNDSDDSNNTNWDMVNWEEETKNSTNCFSWKKLLGPLLMIGGAAATTCGVLSCFGQFAIDDDGTSCGIISNLALNGGGMISFLTGGLCTKKYLCSHSGDNPA